MPHALQVNFEHNQVLHERIVLLTISTADIPTIPDCERIAIDQMDQGFYRVTARYGFMETPNVPQILSLCKLLVSRKLIAKYRGVTFSMHLAHEYRMRLN
jgi:KUP system potassium uptake protein